jgi:hypothetical protein
MNGWPKLTVWNCFQIQAQLFYLLNVDCVDIRNLIKNTAIVWQYRFHRNFVRKHRNCQIYKIAKGSLFDTPVFHNYVVVLFFIGYACQVHACQIHACQVHAC